MKIQFIGTGAGIPSRQRNVSSLALKLLDERNEVWLFDCGEATQHLILESTIRPRKITKIFITHMHGDHIFGLPGLLSSRSFQGGEEPLELFGPPGIKAYLEGALTYSRSRLTYSLKINELDLNGGKLNFDQGWQVTYLPLEHGIPCLGYRVQEPDFPGQLMVDRLIDYQIPNGPIYGQLKRGESVELEDGRLIHGKDFLAPERKGRRVTILGDTRLCRNSIELAQDSDVLVHEATHDSKESKMAHAYYHSTTIQAAKVAKEAKVKQVYLNHISARYLGKAVLALEKEAQAVFPNSRIVNDMDEFDIPIQD